MALATPVKRKFSGGKVTDEVLDKRKRCYKLLKNAEKNGFKSILEMETATQQDGVTLTTAAELHQANICTNYGFAMGDTEGYKYLDALATSEGGHRGQHFAKAWFMKPKEKYVPVAIDGNMDPRKCENYEQAKKEADEKRKRAAEGE